MQLTISRSATMRTVAIILGVGALVTLGIYVTKLITAASPWTQTNWAGGSGQTAFVDPTKYNTDNGNVDTASTPGLFSLKNFRQDLGYSSPLGTERQVDLVSGSASMSYSEQTIAILSNNNYVYVYQDLLDGNLKFRILDPTGANVVSESTIDTTTAVKSDLSTFAKPLVAATGTGFYVVYQARNAIDPLSVTTDFYLKRYSNAGVDSDVGSAKMIFSSLMNANLGASGLAVDSTGDAYITYTVRPWSKVGWPDVFAFAVSATNPAAPSKWLSVQLNTVTDSQREPSIAVNSLGQGAVAWYFDDTGSPFLNVQIHGRVFNTSTGTLVGLAETTISPLVGGIQLTNPDIVVRKDLTGSLANQFSVAWGVSGATDQVLSRTFKTDATTPDPVESFGSGLTSPTAIHNEVDSASGNIIVTWQDGNVYYVEIHDISGTVIVPKTQISPVTTENLYAYAIDVTGNNHLAVMQEQDYTKGSLPTYTHMSSMVYLFPALSGVVTSSILDAGATNTVWGVMTELATLPTGTTAIVRFRTGNTATPDSSWNAYQTIAVGSDIPASFDGRRYAQYEVTLARPNASVAPTFEEINIQYSYSTTTTTTTPGAPSTGQAE